MATALEWHANSRPKLKRSPPGGLLITGFAMHRIIQANIDRFKLLLEIETDPTKRAMLTRLLAEEEAKQVPKTGKKEA